MKKKFIDKVFETIFKDKKNINKKRKVIISSTISISLVILLTLGITLPMTLIDKKIYFNNMIFQNEEDLYSYAKQNAKKSSYSFDTKEYIFDDKLFNNSILLNNYIKEKFNISKEFTNRNIQEFVINTAGELNSLVEMDNNDSIYEIFEGNDSLSYLSENEAKKTFSKNIKKNFAIENKYFENLFSAKEYLKNIKIAELEENKTSECYIVSSICYTKDELTTNIRNEIYSGFILEGNEFSDLNYSEFLEYTKVLSDKTINKYITENINAKYNSYWINHETKNPTGTFSGPQYVETENKLDTKLEFNLVSNTSINQNFVNIALLGSVLKIFIDLSNKEIIEKNDFKLDNFLNLNYKKLNISQENYNLINSFLQNNWNLSSQINQNLNEIKSSDFTPTHKLMVAFKRISELNKIYDLKVEEINIEKLLKDIMLEIISANDDFLKKMSNDKSWVSLLSDEKITYNDIYSIFINPQEFMSKGNWYSAFMNNLINIQKFYDDLINSLDLLNGVADATNELSKEIKEMQDKNNEKAVKEIEKQNQKLTKLFLTKQDEIMEQLHLEDLNSQTYVSPIIVIDLIVKMWDLMSVISFFSYNTYEAKIDNTQSLLYSEMGIKLPLLNIPLSPVGANATSVLLTESPLETMPEIEGIESKQLFVFRNKYFHTKEDAINEMKIDMYLHPENYANTTKMMTNSFNKEHIFTYEIPKICTVNNDENENIDCITQPEYEKQINIEKEKYVNLIFDEEYEHNKMTYYLDGFGNYFDTKEGAITSIREKIDAEKNFNTIFSYSYNGKIIYKSSEEEMIKYINENQVINSKLIIKSDLIETINYKSLTEVSGYKYAIYTFNFYGQKKYFRSENEAIKWLRNNLNIVEFEENRIIISYYFEGIEFLSLKEMNEFLEDKYVNI